MMTKRSVCIYIAAVLILTVNPIYGKKGTCKNKAFTLVDGECYRLNLDEVSWPEARDNCKKWNGELVTFSSPEQKRRVCRALGVTSKYVWIKGPINPQDKGIYWAVSKGGDTDHFALFPLTCASEFQSLCTLTQSKSEVGSTTNEERIWNDEVQKVTCLRKDSVLVDGLCYRSPTGEITSSQAESHCAYHNESLATISSYEQGIDVLKSINFIGQKLLVNNQIENYKGNYAALYETDHCQHYEFGNFPKSLSIRALCMKLPILNLETTTTPASTTTQASTTIQASTTTKASTITQASTTTQGSSTTSKDKKKVINKNELQLVKIVAEKTIIDYDTNITFYEI